MPVPVPPVYAASRRVPSSAMPSVGAASSGPVTVTGALNRTSASTCSSASQVPLSPGPEVTAAPVTRTAARVRRSDTATRTPSDEPSM